jgi:hypothetical protein
LQIPSIGRILRESLPSEIQKWIYLVIDPINSFMLTIKRGLDKGITINENIAGSIQVVRVVSAAVNFSYKHSIPPQAVIIGKVVDVTTAGSYPTAGVGITWSYADNVIRCTFQGLTAGHNYDITLVIFDN